MTVETIMEIPAKLESVGITDTSVMICLGVALVIGFIFAKIKGATFF